MKWIGDRISFIDDKIKTTIVIEPNKNFWINGMMGAWLAMWYTIGGIVLWTIYSLDLKKQETIILIIFLSFWIYYAVKVTRSLLWLMYGKELIKIDETSFQFKKSIKSYGKSIPYYFENMKNLSLKIPEKNSIQAVWESSPWVNGGERLTFEYFGKEIGFGRKLHEKDAQLLFNLVRKRISERNRK
jgi:hypothetical protein